MTVRIRRRALVVDDDRSMVRSLTDVLRLKGWDVTSAFTGKDAVAAASDPIGYVRSDGVTSILYRDANGHIQELFLSGGTWGKADLTAIAGAPAASDGKLFGHVRSDGINQVVFRSSGDQHIYALWLANGTWLKADLTPNGS